MQDGLTRIWSRIRDTAAGLVGAAMGRYGPTVADRARNYWSLTRSDKPIGTFLLLWPTLWALWIAGAGHPRPGVFVVFVLGVIFMRAAGCVINDIWDRGYDAHVKRTQARPIAAGTVSVREASGVFAALVMISFGLVLTQNRLTLELSLVALLLAAVYPFMKRYTYLPQLHLGVAFGWAVPMSFAAQAGAVPPLAWLIFIAVVLWAVAYDTLYAMVDRPDDLRIGVKSTAILFGDLDRHMIGFVQLTFLFAMFLVGRRAGLGDTYNLALLVAAGLMIWQLWVIRHRHLEDCFRAFLSNHWVGMVIFIGIVLDYAFAPYRTVAEGLAP